MDEFGSTISGEDIAVPQELRSLFNDPDEVRVQPLPCRLPGLTSMAVHFAAGARTVPHVHHDGQHLVITDGVGVVGDESRVRVVRAGDVISSPPGSWHWHGAAPGMPATFVTFERPGDVDRDVHQRGWDGGYPPDLGA
jgi:Cupin domain